MQRSRRRSRGLTAGLGLRLTAGLGVSLGVVGPMSGCVSDGPAREDARGAHTHAPDAGLACVSTDADLARLAVYLTGSFSSAAQAREDAEFRDVRLHSAIIWRQRGDGPWIYVEQALGSALEQPYRQRVYRLSRAADGSLRSDVYTLPGRALDYAGWYAAPARFEALDATQLMLREGCSITLRPRASGPGFEGGTDGTGCASELRGASYATSQATILPDRLITWDRGFNAAGEQVWGATTGGYVFVKTIPVDY